MNQSIRNLLTHLFENYGNITQLELEDNDTKMRALWDPNSPFDCLVQQLEHGQDYVDDGGPPYTADQLLCIAYTLVFKTGLYFEDCKAWNTKPNNEKTWTNFKTHFHRAQRLLWDQLRTTKQAGFTSNIATHNHPNENQPPPKYHEALVNLATAATTDHELLTTLATTVANINNHIQNLNKAPIASVHNSETTNSTALSSITSSRSDLQQQLADLKRENANSTTKTPDVHAPDGTMAITVGPTATVLRTNTTVPPVKTKPLATKTMLHVKTPWVAAKPTNPPTLDSEGGVFQLPLLN